MNIYILQDGEQLGPYTVGEINDKLTRGELSADTLAWFDGSPEWIPLGAIPGTNGAQSSFLEFSGQGRPCSQNSTSGEGARESHPGGEDGNAQTTADNLDPQKRFFEQTFHALQLATISLMEPFQQLDEVVRTGKSPDPTKFFRLFLRHAAKFNEDCATAFATTLRQSTRLDAVRATTVKQLTREIRAEAFDACDQALAEYHETVNVLMGGAGALMEQVEHQGTPMGTAGGALLGGLVAGKGSRVAGAAAGGIMAMVNFTRTINRQVEMLGQAQTMIEQAEKIAPVQVGVYLDAVAEMPEALVDLLGAKCFGGAVNRQAQQQCLEGCVAHVKRLNMEAVESVRAMYEHVARLTAAAEAEEAREVEARQQEQKARDRVARYIKLAILLPLWLALSYAFMDGDYSSTGVIMGGVTAAVCVAMLWFVFSWLMRALRS